MAKNNRFGGVIWTDHALDRMYERGIPREYAIEAFKNPDSSEKNKNGFKLTKQIEDKTITLIITKNEKNEWVSPSIWMDPPLLGTKEYKNQQRYKEYKKGSLGKKIWITILKQLGI